MGARPLPSVARFVYSTHYGSAPTSEPCATAWTEQQHPILYPLWGLVVACNYTKCVFCSSPVREQLVRCSVRDGARRTAGGLCPPLRRAYEQTQSTAETVDRLNTIKSGGEWHGEGVGTGNPLAVYSIDFTALHFFSHGKKCRIL